MFTKEDLYSWAHYDRLIEELQNLKCKNEDQEELLEFGLAELDEANSPEFVDMCFAYIESSTQGLFKYKGLTGEHASLNGLTGQKGKLVYTAKYIKDALDNYVARFWKGKEDNKYIAMEVDAIGYVCPNYIKGREHYGFATILDSIIDYDSFCGEIA